MSPLWQGQSVAIHSHLPGKIGLPFGYRSSDNHPNRSPRSENRCRTLFPDLPPVFRRDRSSVDSLKSPAFLQTPYNIVPSERVYFQRSPAPPSPLGIWAVRYRQHLGCSRKAICKHTAQKTLLFSQQLPLLNVRMHPPI